MSITDEDKHIYFLYYLKSSQSTFWKVHVNTKTFLDSNRNFQVMIDHGRLMEVVGGKDLQNSVLWEVGTTLRPRQRDLMSNQKFTLLMNCNLAKANNMCEHCEEIGFFFFLLFLLFSWVWRPICMTHQKAFCRGSDQRLTEIQTVGRIKMAASLKRKRDPALHGCPCYEYCVREETLCFVRKLSMTRYGPQTYFNAALRPPSHLKCQP